MIGPEVRFSASTPKYNRNGFFTMSHWYNRLTPPHALLMCLAKDWRVIGVHALCWSLSIDFLKWALHCLLIQLIFDPSTGCGNCHFHSANDTLSVNCGFLSKRIRTKQTRAQISGHYRWPFTMTLIEDFRKINTKHPPLGSNRGISRVCCML